MTARRSPLDVFVLGLTDFQRGALTTIRDARRVRFHQLLDRPTVANVADQDFEQLLARARVDLAAAGGSVDAIIAHWDFPTSVLAPLLAAEHGLPAPSLDSVLRCEHKYWSRLEQAASVPGCVPRFCAFDPFADDPLAQIDLDFPFWVKPVKAHSSMLGFAVRDAADLDVAVRAIRAGIGPVARAFDQALLHVDLPEEIRRAPGTTCLAEQLVAGVQVAHEGAMSQGRFSIHGTLDMLRELEGNSFSRLVYPARTVPAEVEGRMAAISECYLRHIGFDNGCFNAEFMWDPAADQLWLIEVNTRISQSHSDLFAKVDGVSNHEVALAVALGIRPSMPHRQGRFGAAAKVHLRHRGDGTVLRVPTAVELAAITRRFPETHVHLKVTPGQRLADLAFQDTYTYELATVYLGAADHAALDTAYRTVVDALCFEIDTDPDPSRPEPHVPAPIA